MTPEKLYDLYGEKMFHYAAFRLGSSQDAEDVLQETFYRLSRYPIRWAFIRDGKAFVFKVLRNETNRFLRKKLSLPFISGLKADRESPSMANSVVPARYGSDIATAFISGGDSSRDGILVDESGDHLSGRTAAALAALPDEQREVIILKIFQDMSFKEIAVVCGLSINTAASRYRYGLEKLRAVIAREA